MSFSKFEYSRPSEFRVISVFFNFRLKILKNCELQRSDTFVFERKLTSLLFSIFFFIEQMPEDLSFDDSTGLNCYVSEDDKIEQGSMIRVKLIGLRFASDDIVRSFCFVGLIVCFLLRMLLEQYAKTI